MSAESILAAVTAQGLKIRELKTGGADKAALKPEASHPPLSPSAPSPSPHYFSERHMLSLFRAAVKGGDAVLIS